MGYFELKPVQSGYPLLESISSKANRIRISAAGDWINGNGYSFQVNNNEYIRTAGSSNGSDNSDPVSKELVERVLAIRLNNWFGDTLNVSLNDGYVLLESKAQDGFSLSSWMEPGFGNYSASFIFVTDNGSAKFSLQYPLFSGNLTSVKSENDPDGNGDYAYHWQRSTDGTNWFDINPVGADYTISQDDEGSFVRSAVSYVDGGGFNERVFTNSVYVPFVDSGDASFSVAGVSALGRTVTAENILSDPDGNGTFSYLWQSSTDGANWTNVGSDSQSYIVAKSEAGKLLRVKVAYSDVQGFSELVTASTNSGFIGSTSTTVSRTTTLASTISRLTLTGTGNINGTGNALNNYLTGNVGNNILDGGAGNDILAGGRGNDTYIVDSIYDSIIENMNEGIEIIQSSVNWILGANLEKLTLTGSGNLSGTGNELNNTIIGNGGNNVLDGGSGIDILDGGSGNDTLIGGLGNDVLKGGAGNDTYHVDSTGDSIADTIGTDTVVSSISWTLGSNLENLTLTGIDALTGIGNNDKNSIVGNSGNNVLDGLAGTDFLTGGAGADVFRFSTKPSFGASSADHITDFKASEGDGLEISASLLGLTMGPTVRIGLSVTTVSNASALTTALGSVSTFVYDSSNGNLYWNQNGNKSGFGTGGIFAVLDNKSALTSSNISLF